jgi:hypothetical protein
MPINGTHYIGIDFDKPSNLHDIFSDEKYIEDVGMKGREWALEYYSPTRIASRFLDIIADEN